MNFTQETEIIVENNVGIIKIFRIICERTEEVSENVPSLQFLREFKEKHFNEYL